MAYYPERMSNVASTGGFLSIVFLCQYLQHSLFSVETAWRTFQGDEAMNMIRKGQVKTVGKGDMLSQVALVSHLFGVAA